MPITIGDAGKDTLGDVLKQPSGESGYDPRKWQDEANGKAKNRVFYGAGQVELVEPLPDVPRIIELPGTPAEAAKAIDQFLLDNPDIVPFKDEGIAEINKMLAQNPNGNRSDIFNVAVYRICKNHGLSLSRPARIEANTGPTPAEIQRNEVKRLESESARVKNPPRNWATDSRSMDNASLRSMPAARPKARR
jgi:hypothetical protein